MYQKKVVNGFGSVPLFALGLIFCSLGTRSSASTFDAAGNVLVDAGDICLRNPNLVKQGFQADDNYSSVTDGTDIDIVLAQHPELSLRDEEVVIA